jgi:hypothetical protein
MIDFKTTDEDTATIQEIAKRAMELFGMDVMMVTLDVTACHLNGCPLKLAELLAADNSNFAHDIAGIGGHLDRRTGELRDCFLPRFAAP